LINNKAKKKGETKMRLIEFPNIEIKNVEDVQRFYHSLPISEPIKARTVVINKKRTNEILSRMRQETEDDEQHVRLNLFWLMYGPSSSDKVPYGKVGIREVDEI
jgi:hypothetical protein